MQFEEAKEFILAKLRADLPQHLTYHSLNHIEDVYSAAAFLGKEEGITGDDHLLLLTAALFHDSGFMQGPKEHERVSCEIARQHLPGFGYTDAQLEKIDGMIMATQIPQSPKNLLEEIICDADLDYLGRDDFELIGNKLFAELSMFGILNNEDEWNRLQVRFLEKHQYFTKTAIRLRGDKKQAHLDNLKKLTGRL